MLSYLTFTISPEQEGLTVEQLLREQGFSDVKVVKDLAGLDRVVEGYYR